MNQQRIIAAMSGADRSLFGHGYRALAGIAAVGAGWALGWRNRGYDRGSRARTRASVPVISVGNLTTGGTGKTPMVMDLARRLIALGEKPAILLRGYKPGAAGSDEAALYTATLGGQVPVGTDADRVRGAAHLVAHHPDVSVILLDDGFQHRRLARDLDLVLIDATQPFGFGRLLPRGLLREPPANLARAAAVIVTRSDQVLPADLAQLDAEIARYAGRAPAAHAAHRWNGLRDESGLHPLAALQMRRVLGVCAIGNPQAFERQLRATCAQVAGVLAFNDHHDFAKLGLDLSHAPAHDALLVTEKDWVKLRGKTGTVPVYRPVLEIAYLDGEQEVTALLAGVLPAARR